MRDLYYITILFSCLETYEKSEFRATFPEIKYDCIHEIDFN